MLSLKFPPRLTRTCSSQTTHNTFLFTQRKYNIIKSEIGEKYNQGRMRKINLFRSSTLRSSVQTTAAASATVMRTLC
jgi:hypothetical protein